MDVCEGDCGVEVGVLVWKGGGGRGEEVGFGGTAADANAAHVAWVRRAVRDVVVCKEGGERGGK